MADTGCGCGNTDIAKATVQAEPAQCPAIVHETVCVQAEITITPDVEVGEFSSFCVGAPVIGGCDGTPVASCTFTVSQNICVQIPLNFSANATAVPAGLVCGIPGSGPCESAP